MKKRYIGLMSGTSLDGVDVALCQIDNEVCHLEATHFVSFSTTLRDAIMNLIQNKINIRDIGKLDHLLALFFAKAVNELLEKISLSSKEIDAIGVHGQTCGMNQVENIHSLYSWEMLLCWQVRQT